MWEGAGTHTAPMRTSYMSGAVAHKDERHSRMVTCATSQRRCAGRRGVVTAVTDDHLPRTMPHARRSTFVPTPAPDLDRPHDPGFEAADARAARALAGLPEHLVGRPIPRPGGHEIRVGTASWTDPTMVRSGFYPRGSSTAEARLRYYASQFSVVEVDATYYSLPDPATAQLWAERTPDDFVFHVKAHALMTGQPTEVARLPRALVEALPAALAGKARIYAKDLPDELLDVVWEYFLGALEPLRAVGKLGGILLQFPRWIIPDPAGRRLVGACAARLGGTPGAVELRNGLWYTTSQGDTRAARWTLDLLRDHGLAYVMVDGPQGLDSSVPPLVGVTTPSLAMVRLHGRRASTWEAAKVATVERYRYLYDERELAEWSPRVDEAAAQAARTVVLLNNCYGNYGATNAREMIRQLTS